MTDRMATCPGCAKPVRLTEDELVQKRGFCALCDTEFDVQRSMLQGGAPFRAVELAHAAPLATRPPSSRVYDLSDARGPRLGLEVANPARTIWGFMAGFSLAGAVVGGLAGIWLAMAWMGAGSLLAAALRQSRQEVVLEGEELVCTTRFAGVPFRKRVAIADIAWIDALRQPQPLTIAARYYYVRVTVDGKDTIKIGAGQGHSEETMTWLAGRLRALLHKARQAGSSG